MEHENSINFQKKTKATVSYLSPKKKANVFFTLTHCHKQLRGYRNKYNYKYNMHGLIFKDQIFKNVKFQATTMTSCKLQGARLIGVDFYNSNLKKSSFKNAVLEHVVFFNCNLKGVNFTGTKFNDVSFICTSTRMTIGLDKNIGGIHIYRKYCKAELPENTIEVLQKLSSKASVFSYKVLHVNTSKLNYWTIQIIIERFGVDGINYLAMLLTKKQNWKNLYTIYSYLELLNNTYKKCYNKLPCPGTSNSVCYNV